MASFNDFFSRNMDAVPALVFGSLPVSDLRSARMVCSKWRNLIDSSGIIPREVRRRLARGKPSRLRHLAGAPLDSVAEVRCHGSRIYVLCRDRLHVLEKGSLLKVGEVPYEQGANCSLIFSRSHAILVGKHPFDPTRQWATVLNLETLERVGQGNRGNFGQSFFFPNCGSSVSGEIFSLAPPGSEYSLLGQVPSGHYMRGSVWRMQDRDGVFRPAKELSFVDWYQIVACSEVVAGRIFFQCMEYVARLVDLKDGRGRPIWEQFAVTPTQSNTFSTWKRSLKVLLTKDFALRAYSDWNSPGELVVDVWSAATGAKAASVRRPTSGAEVSLSASRTWLALTPKCGERTNYGETVLIELETGRVVPIADKYFSYLSFVRETVLVVQEPNIPSFSAIDTTEAQNLASLEVTPALESGCLPVTETKLEFVSVLNNDGDTLFMDVDANTLCVAYF